MHALATVLASTAPCIDGYATSMAKTMLALHYAPLINEAEMVVCDVMIDN